MKDGHYFDKNGHKVWVQNGVLHRLDGPAKIWKNGSHGWYQNGVIHREDGPAHISPGSRKAWIQNGLYHRLDGPAIIYKTGSGTYEQWFKNGELHRIDGPAVVGDDRTPEYYLNGIKYNKIKNDVQWLIEIQKIRRQERQEGD